MKAPVLTIPIILSLIATMHVDGACPNTSATPVNIGNSTGGFEILCGPVNPRIRVVGNPGPIVFVGVGGGGAGGSAGGSGFAGNNTDNGGGAGGGAGAPILGFQVGTATGDVFEITIGTGGPGPASGGSMGTSGTAGGNGTSSFVRRADGPNLVVFPGGQGGHGGVGSTNQPAIAPGGAATTGGANGGNGGADSKAGDFGGQSFVLAPTSCQRATGGATDADHGGGGGGGGSALCIGGNGGDGGSSQGSAGGPGMKGQFGSGGGGAGARGAGGEVGAGGGNGGDGLVIVFWGDQARDFPIATDRSSLTMSDAGVRRVQNALREQAHDAAFRQLCPCLGQ